MKDINVKLHFEGPFSRNGLVITNQYERFFITAINDEVAEHILRVLNKEITAILPYVKAEKMFLKLNGKQIANISYNEKMMRGVMDFYQATLLSDEITRYVAQAITDYSFLDIYGGPYRIDYGSNYVFNVNNTHCFQINGDHPSVIITEVIDILNGYRHGPFESITRINDEIFFNKKEFIVVSGWGELISRPNFMSTQQAAETQLKYAAWIEAVLKGEIKAPLQQNKAVNSEAASAMLSMGLMMLNSPSYSIYKESLTYGTPGDYSNGARSNGFGSRKAKEGPKIRRNEKCPCNSGKKYKKCCYGTY